MNAYLILLLCIFSVVSFDSCMTKIEHMEIIEACSTTDKPSTGENDE